MVLFHQRTGSSLSESALSARLQYGSATLVLAVSLSLAISMELLLSGDCAAPLQTGRPRRTGTPPRALLDRLSLDLFHFLDNPRILFHALLPCARAAAGFGHGHWRRMDSPWNARALRSRRSRRRCVLRDICCRSKSPTPGDISDALSRHPNVY